MSETNEQTDHPHAQVARLTVYRVKAEDANGKPSPPTTSKQSFHYQMTTEWGARQLETAVPFDFDTMLISEDSDQIEPDDDEISHGEFARFE